MLLILNSWHFGGKNNPIYGFNNATFIWKNLHHIVIGELRHWQWFSSFFLTSARFFKSERSKISSLRLLFLVTSACVGVIYSSAVRFLSSPGKAPHLWKPSLTVRSAKTRLWSSWQNRKDSCSQAPGSCMPEMWTVLCGSAARGAEDLPHVGSSRQLGLHFQRLCPGSAGETKQIQGNFGSHHH